MKVSVSRGSLAGVKSQLTMVPITEGEKLSFQTKEMSAKEGKMHVLYSGYKGSKLLLLVGLGKKKELTKEKVRKAFASAVKKAKSLNVEEFLVVSNIAGMNEKESSAAITEGILLGNYAFDKYKTKKKEEKEVKGFAIVAGGDVSREVKEAEIVCGNANLIRDMVNENADVMTTTKIASIARDIARKNHLRLRILEKHEMERLGMNLLLGVSRGSIYPPRMIILEYRGNKKSKDKIALVGKGITFDSGGINIKPSGWIETMRQDMAGAATVIGAIKTVAELKLPVNLVAVAPVCENMISRHAQKPGDIVKGYSGKTVEIENTDAEGRLILGDALAYTEKVIKPSAIITVATLTGAVLAIFGEYVAPMMGTSKHYMKKLYDSGERTHERVWELPLYEEFMEEVKGETSDIRNLGYNKRYAGTIMGGAFLKNFVDKTPFVHVDIAGTAWWEKPRGHVPKGGTGFGVRLLTDFFKHLHK